VSPQQRLDWLRHHLPHWWWLFYDGFLAAILIYSITRGVVVATIGLLGLIAALAIDLWEYVLKKQGAQ
jgi:uncharacterized membrane protein